MARDDKIRTIRCIGVTAVVLYVMWSFVKVDVFWFNDVLSWREGERMQLLLGLLECILIGSLASFALKPR